MPNVIFEVTILIVCTLSIPVKEKAGKTFYQCECKQLDSISVILWHVEISLNSLKILKNRLRKSSVFI